LKEREGQIQHRRKLREIERKQDAKYEVLLQANMAKLAEREVLEEKQRKEKGRAMAASQTKQLEEAQARHHTAQLAEMRQGEINKRLAQEAAQEQSVIDAKRRHGMREFNQDYIRMNKEQALLKQERLKQEALEDAKVKKFAEEKDRIMTMRRDVEQSRLQAKQQNFQAIIKAQYDHLKKIREEESTRVERQVQEMQKKADDKEASDNLRRDTLLKDMVRARDRQLSRKNQAELARVKEEKVVIEQWRTRAKEMDEEEKVKEREARDRSMQTAQFLKTQSDENRERRAKERRDDLETEKARLTDSGRDEHVFQQYCDTALADFRDLQQATIPMQLVMRGQTNTRLKPSSHFR